MPRYVRAGICGIESDPPVFTYDCGAMHTITLSQGFFFIAHEIYGVYNICIIIFFVSVFKIETFTHTTF